MLQILNNERSPNQQEAEPHSQAMLSMYPQKFLAVHAILRRNSHDFIQPTVLVRWHIYQLSD